MPQTEQTETQVNDPANTPLPFEQTIDVPKALKLRLINNLSYQEIADMMGHSKAGIFKALNNILSLLDNPVTTDAYKSHKAKILEGVQLKYVAHMANEATIKKASANNAAYAASQLDNMIRLERNQSTQNLNVQQLDRVIDDRQAEIDRLRSELGIGSEPDIS